MAQDKQPAGRAARASARESRAAGRRARRAGPDTPLTRERIVSAAIGIVDSEGLSALSMRRLGADLGVDPMAVYYHVPNKEALFDAIVEAVMAEIDLTGDDPSAPAEERILWAAHAYRDAMLAHVNALPIVLSRGPSTPVAMRPVEVLIGILRDAGLPPARAMAGMNAIAAAVRGIVGMIASAPAGAADTRGAGRARRALPRRRVPAPARGVPLPARTSSRPTSTSASARSREDSWRAPVPRSA